MKGKIVAVLTLVMVLAMLVSPVLAAPAPPKAPAPPPGPAALIQSANASGPATYIIQLQDPPLASYQGGIDGLAPTSPSALGKVKLDSKSLASVAYVEYLYAQQDQIAEPDRTDREPLGHSQVSL